MVWVALWLRSSIMTGFDYAVFTIIGFSIFLSLMRGLTQEILSLLAWVAAFWCASEYADQATALLPKSLEPETSIIVAFVGIIFAVWLLTLFVKLAVGQFIRMTGLGIVDRVLGLGFGFLRGSAIVIAMVLIAGMTKFPQLPMWRNAMLSDMCVTVALEVLPWLPPKLAAAIRY